MIVEQRSYNQSPLRQVNETAIHPWSHSYICQACFGQRRL
jgi:hypothetical protein